jgi:hypothetical protein
MVRNDRVASRGIGWALVALGVLINQWTVTPLAGDGDLDPARGTLILLVFQLPLVLLGLLFIRRPDLRSVPTHTNTIVGIAAVVYAILVVEVMLRAVPGQPVFSPAPRAVVGDFPNRSSPKRFTTDPFTGWRMAANVTFRWSVDGQWSHYQANSQGFRSPHHYEARDDQRTIAIVGDSFAFGMGVDQEDTFGAVLERRLEPQTIVYNFAMPGFGLDQMWMSVRHQALPLKPDLLVVAFIDEDLDRSLTAFRQAEGFNKPTFELEDDTLRPQTPADRPNMLVRFLDRHSAIWTAGRLASRALGYHTDIGKWWRLNKAVFRSIVTDAKRAGVPLLFLRLPLKDWQSFPNLDRFMAVEQARFLNLGDSHARPVFDVHFRTDGHINAAGHRFVAAALLPLLQDEAAQRQPLLNERAHRQLTR